MLLVLMDVGREARYHGMDVLVGTTLFRALRCEGAQNGETWRRPFGHGCERTDWQMYQNAILTLWLWGPRLARNLRDER